MLNFFKKNKSDDLFNNMGEEEAIRFAVDMVAKSLPENFQLQVDVKRQGGKLVVSTSSEAEYDKNFLENLIGLMKQFN